MDDPKQFSEKIIMKPLRLKLQEKAKEHQVAQYVIEKDYALSYVLAGISNQTKLADSLIFKGGTALKKVFFGDYRFSEDLDFSSLNAPKNNALESALQEAVEATRILLSQHGLFQVELKRNPERATHPMGQEAFIILIKYPWQPTALCRIKIEITHDEPLMLAPEYRIILHNYEEELDFKIACYSIEEIIAEKMRALLQTHQKLISRPRARDYYDLWFILKNHHNMNKINLLNILDKKCEHRNVSYQSVEDFFTPQLIKEAHQHWQSTLDPFVQNLPKCEIALDDTRLLITNLLGTNPESVRRRHVDYE